MLYRVSKNGGLLSAGTPSGGRLPWGVSRADSGTNDHQFRITVSGVNICDLPICCRDAETGLYRKVVSVAGDAPNGTVAPVENFQYVNSPPPARTFPTSWCAWGAAGESFGTVSLLQGGTDCDNGTPVDIDIQCSLNYLQDTDQFELQIFVLSGGASSKSFTLFHGFSEPGKCLPVTIDSIVGGYGYGTGDEGCGCDSLGSGYIGYGGSATVELICPEP